MDRTWSALWAIGVMVANAGCSSDDSASNSAGGAPAGGGAAGAGGTISSGGASGSGGTGGSGGTSPPITVSGVVSDYYPLATDPPKPLEGVQVCLHGSSIPCAMTDATGTYTLTPVPGHAEIALLFTKEGYANQARVFTTTLEDLTANLSFPVKAVGWIFADLAGFTVPLNGKGIIMSGSGQQVSADGGTSNVGLAGSTFSMSPKIGKGPVYGGLDSPLPDLSATQTGKSGAVGWGDLPPGEYTITVSHPGKTCSTEGRGWPASAAGSVRVPAIAGYGVQGVWFLCK